jgi:hypothetical protein
MNYHFHPEALHEYAEATRYYAEISTSLSTGFVSQVENGINQILLYRRASNRGRCSTIPGKAFSVRNLLYN